MPRITDDDKRSRLERIHLLLKRNPRGLTEAEIADEVNIGRRTVNTYLQDLEFEGKAFKDGIYWFPLILKESQLRPLDLSPEEAVTLYLGARLLSKQQDKRNEPAETALLKLANALKADAGVGAEIEQAARELAQRPVQKEYQPIFRDIVRGYIYHRKIEIAYRPLNWNKSFQTTFSTYLLEPSPIGFTTYLIGHSSIVDKWRAYKLERIESVRLTKEEYALPPDFPGLEILRNAWSIVMGEETVRVVLRFSERVKARVLETRWHPSQQTRDDLEKPNSLLWEVQVADTLDLLPWIRSWGADVEALEPEKLREELKQTTKDLGIQYQVSQPMDTPTHHLLWAKADNKRKDSYDYHLLHYHLIDVGNAALELWNSGLNDILRKQIAEWLRLDINDAGKLIAFWASVHDLGKASPAFQDHPYMPKKLRSKIQRELQNAGLHFPPRSDGEKRARHEVISTLALKDEKLLTKHSSLPAPFADLIAQMLGGHHGAFPQSYTLTRLGKLDTGENDWGSVRETLVQELVKVFQPPVMNDFQLENLKDNIALTLVVGIISVADWLGSDEKNFPFEKSDLPIVSYINHSRQHARYAVLRTKWEKAPIMPKFNFERSFGFMPRQAQQQVKDTLNQVALPAIAIIEAPMGSGKTEAAMAVYAQWAKMTKYSGLYVAMPTTATSNQMYSRVSDFLSKQFGKDVEPLLVHSQALLRDIPEETSTIEEDDGNYQANSQAWFLPRKKSLLVPFGVGTVDQALMSILQTKHFFVRLLGLSHKIVIFDEVHAYDAYMSELFERLLAWLRQLGVSVIVLSATLPDKTRQKLIRAYTGNSSIPQAVKYPRLTFATSDGRVDAIELAPPDKKTLEFNWIDRDEDNIVQTLEKELQDGGCAVVICNTVTRAQKLYDILNQRDPKLCDKQNLILFHARFPMAWREELEQTVLKKFGANEKDKSKPNPDRPQKAIVVATQVVEQSLDLDFDVMISDHAPVDLLLQRAGRLHRHSVNDSTRIHPYHPYCLLVAAPDSQNSVPKFEKSDTFVYEENILLRSWIALNNILTKQIVLPTDLPTLIESVYGDIEITDKSDLQSLLSSTKEKMIKDGLEMKKKARSRLIAKPESDDLLWGENAALEEDDPSVNETFQALTRSDRPGINVVCLHRVNGQLLLEPDDPETAFVLTAKLEKAIIRELVRHSANVRHFDSAVERFLISDPDDAERKAILSRWKKVAALRYHRVVIFENSTFSMKGTGYIMRLDKKDELGLRITKEAR